MHVDAFFEYLLNKPHVYWTQVPSISEPPSEFGRDGVAAEEDLALRALLPETRPKRGRRKAEDRDDEIESGKSPLQRPRLDSPTLSEEFMIARASLIADNTTPATAHLGFSQAFDDGIVPWSATDMRGSIPGAFRWPPPDNTQTPLSAYPQSAVTPSTRTHLWNDATEPRSAITPKGGRSRRRHGPAVSSAWPSNGSTSSGKLRGRPPSNRSITDGPFSTFPVIPSSRDVPTINLRDQTPTATPVVSDSQVPHFFPSVPTPAPPNPPALNSRPSRLQLQVPQRQGGSVRLATPPPIVLVNGEDDTNIQHSILTNHQNAVPMMEYFQSTENAGPNFQHFVSIAFRQNEDTDRTNVDALESHFISEILAADWYDESGASVERCTIDEAAKICKQVVKNLQAESSSTEAFLINLSALAGGPLMTRLRITRLEHGQRTDYECHWKMRFGSIEGDFTIRATVEQSPDTAAIMDHGDPGDTELTWKKRYLDLQQQIRVRDEKVGKLKRGVLDALVVSNQFSRISSI
jgi:hypothetical protein